MNDHEHKEQTLVVRWFRLQYAKYNGYLWAIPNGGLRHIRTAARLKDEGVMAGVADLFLMIPNGGWHGLFIEMKAKGGRLTESQKDFIGRATLMGYQAQVCFGFDDAKKVIEDYLKGQ